MRCPCPERKSDSWWRRQMATVTLGCQAWLVACVNDSIVMVVVFSSHTCPRVLSFTSRSTCNVRLHWYSGAHRSICKRICERQSSWCKKEERRDEGKMKLHLQLQLKLQLKLQLQLHLPLLVPPFNGVALQPVAICGCNSITRLFFVYPIHHSIGCSWVVVFFLPSLLLCNTLEEWWEEKISEW